MATPDHYQPQHLNRWTAADPAFGSTDNYVGGDFADCYVAPCSITRDTADSVSLSNWEAMVGELDSLIQHEDSGETYFNHWACGWYSIYIIHHTDTAALKAADRMAASLAEYPVLDEDALSKKETDLENEAWENWAQREWRDTVEKALAEYAPGDAGMYWESEILDTVPDERIANLWFNLSQDLSWTVLHEGDGPRFNFEDASEKLDSATLADLTGLPLLPVSQEWRREPYPWPGAEPSPLAPPLSGNKD